MVRIDASGNIVDGSRELEEHSSLQLRLLGTRRQCRDTLFTVAPSFWVQVVLFVVCALALVFVDVNAIFILALLDGWLISLCLHEGSHALAAYYGGDSSVKEQAYLSLDILKYTDLTMTIILPMLLLLLGGVPLPGAAVPVNTAALKSPKWESFVAFAGPLSNFVFGAVMSLMAHFLSILPRMSHHRIAVLFATIAYFQVLAVVLNLLPLPPLDGWGIVSPFLRDDCFVKRLMKNPYHARSINMITFLIIFVGVSYIPGVAVLQQFLIENILRLDAGDVWDGTSRLQSLLRNGII